MFEATIVVMTVVGALRCQNDAACFYCGMETGCGSGCSEYGGEGQGASGYFCNGDLATADSGIL